MEEKESKPIGHIQRAMDSNIKTKRETNEKERQKDWKEMGKGQHKQGSQRVNMWK